MPLTKPDIGLNIENLKLPVLLILISNFNLCFGIPLLVWKNNFQNFVGVDIFHLAISAAVTFLIFSLIGVIALISAVILFGRFTNKFSYFEALLVFLSLWVVLTGYALPVIRNSGIFSPLSPPIDFPKLALAVVFCVLVTWAVFRFALAKRLFINLTCTISLSSLILLPLIGETKETEYSSGSDYLTVSTKQNIFVISFDGLTSSVMRDALRKMTKPARIFKDFSFYSNVVSQSPATTASILGELYGVQDFKKIGKTTAEIKQYFSASKSLNRISVLDASEDAFVLGPYSYYAAPNKTTQNEKIYLMPSNFGMTLGLVSTSHCRIGLCVFGKYMRLENYRKYLLHIPKHYENFETLPVVYERDMFRTVVNGLRTSELKRESVRMAHFSHTHFPIRTMENCEFGTPDWSAENQNYQGMLGQAKCAWNQLSTFVSKLKELGIYDKSLIILKSDHGKPAYYFDEAPGNITINGHRFWGLNRYQPLLMIKNFDQQQNEMRYVDDVVLLNDIAITLCLIYSPSDQCSGFHGVDMFAKEPLDPGDEKYFVYVPKSPSSSHDFKDHLSVKVNSRKITFEQFLLGAQASGQLGK